MLKLLSFCTQAIIFFVLSFSFKGQMEGVDSMRLKDNFSNIHSPFHYPLNITLYPSKNKDAGVFLCLHGYGGNYETGWVISQNLPDYHMISFDFPDAQIHDKNFAIRPMTFGSIQELLPAIFVAKQCLMAGGLSVLNLYGFSAGGAALVNMLAVLNTEDYDAQLASIGVSLDDKRKILEAVQKGYVILDCPLKSMEEIMAFRGKSPELDLMAKQYADNGLRPIDSLNNLKGLSLNVILNFQNPDEIIFNRDDNLFADTLKKVNEGGRTIVVTSYDKGHVAYHSALWTAFQKLQSE